MAPRWLPAHDAAPDGRPSPRRRHADDCGFTLIELLIVLIILGVLAAIVVIAVGRLVGLAPQAACKSDYRAVEEAVQGYDVQEGGYPTGPNGVAILLAKAPSPPGGPWLRDAPYSPGHFQIVVRHGVNIEVYSAPRPTPDFGGPIAGTPIPGHGMAACDNVT